VQPQPAGANATIVARVTAKECTVPEPTKRAFGKNVARLAQRRAEGKRRGGSAP